MKIIKKEYHQVISTFDYDIPDEAIELAFGSLERFKQLVSHFTSSDEWDYEPVGDEPTDEESDTFIDFFADYDYGREDDWWSERKGGYETSYHLGDD